MKHNITLETNELTIIREAIHLITIKGTDAWAVGKLLNTIYEQIAIAKNVENEVSPPIVDGMMLVPDEQPTKNIKKK
jgi:hypothetical protein